MAFVRIVLLSVAAACLYGVIHDQVTARICLEYFTVAHPRLVASDSPTIHGLLWGILATWWVGLALGVATGVAARIGRFPKLSASDLVRPIAVLLLVNGVAAFVAGCVARWLVIQGRLHVPAWVAAAIPAVQHVNFVTVAAAHATSYAVGLLGGVGVILFVVIVRVQGGDRWGRGATQV